MRSGGSIPHLNFINGFFASQKNVYKLEIFSRGGREKKGFFQTEKIEFGLHIGKLHTPGLTDGVVIPLPTAPPFSSFLFACTPEPTMGWRQASEDDFISVFPKVPAKQKYETVVVFEGDGSWAGDVPEAMDAAS